MSLAGAFNVVLFGDTSVGRDSVINFILGDHSTVRPVLSALDARRYDVTIRDKKFRIFDTPGLDKPRLLEDPAFMISVLGYANRLVGSLSDFGGINLLVFCMPFSGITLDAEHNFRIFHDFLCQKRVPSVGLVVLNNREICSHPQFIQCGPYSVHHVCITTNRESVRRYHASRLAVHDLLIAYGSGLPFLQERVGWVTELFQKTMHSIKFRPLLHSFPRWIFEGEDERGAMLTRICSMDSVAPNVLDDEDSDSTRFPSDLTGQVILEGREPVAAGGFANIHRGKIYINVVQVTKVAIKVIRTYSEQDNDFCKKEKRLRREIKVWLNLRHDNILPLLGTVSGFGQFPAMVCPWAENGTLTSYLRERYDCFSEVKILRLIEDVACGLRYLHSCNVVHGDLSGSNVLIDEYENAYITDFGLSTMLAELGGSAFSTSFQGRGTIRWIAPELLGIGMPEDEHAEPLRILPTTCSDVYSFGGIMLQVLSGQVPYHYLAIDGQVVHAISKGYTPKRPTVPLVTESRWAFIQRCWSTDDIARTRPSGEEIVDFAKSELASVEAS